MKVSVCVGSGDVNKKLQRKICLFTDDNTRRKGNIVKGRKEKNLNHGLTCGAQVEELGAPHIQGDLLLQLHQQRVHQEGVLHHNRHLSQHRLIA
jgi:hypothetical protein